MTALMLAGLIAANLLFFCALLTLTNWVLEQHHKWRFGFLCWSLTFVSAIILPLVVGALSVSLGGRLLS